MRRGVRSTLTTAMVLVSAVLVLAGCSGGNLSARPTPPKSPTSTASTTTASSATPSVAAPTLPAEAKADDPDGAAAFIRYYFQVANHAYATGDLSTFDQIREQSCEACASLEGTVQDAYGPGGRIQGGLIEVGDVVVTPGHPDLGLSAKVVLSQEPGSLLDSDGVGTDPVNGAEELLVSAIVRFVGHWVMVEWGTAVVPSK